MKKNNSGGTRIAEQTTERSADLRAKTAEAAYYRAERRCFIGGDPVDDWLTAESELLSAAPEHRDEAEVNDSPVVTFHRR